MSQSSYYVLHIADFRGFWGVLGAVDRFQPIGVLPFVVLFPAVAADGLLDGLLDGGLGFLPNLLHQSVALGVFHLAVAEQLSWRVVCAWCWRCWKSVEDNSEILLC